ncbi:extracellular solute-binding protein [Amphibacillus jilinensis]|uniref:extracellular solute-binding protein n=1 Tax=Amphibacillus jilinensis TaxID=1216008 RepID=UPI0002FA65BA|nr:extracellular solute-binding protein [Amphibacillus jilinensis]
MKEKDSHKSLCWFIVLLLSYALMGCEATMKSDDDPVLMDNVVKTDYPHLGLSKYEEVIDIRLVRETSDNIARLVEHFPDETLTDNRWINLYHEVLGINIQYDWIAETPLYDQQLATDLMSGQLPDIFKVNTQQLQQLAEAGLIQDLSHVFDDYATPLTKDVMIQEGVHPLEAATIDQKLMGIPEVESSIETAQFMWIRTDWLEQVNLNPPKTIDDVLTISKAFTFDDPNQTGEDDTYGLAVTDYLWNNIGGLVGFMAGYGAYPNIWVLDDSGELVYGGIQPEVKEALTVLQELYRSGQIDNEFMFKDGSKVKEQIANGEVGMLYGEQWASFYVEESVEKNKNAKWAPFPIVSATFDSPQIPIQNKTNNFWVVRSEFEYPEAIVKLINLHLEKNWGETAEYDVYYSTPYSVWQLSPVTPYPVLKNLEAFYQLEEARNSDNFSNLNGEAAAIHSKIENYFNVGDKTGWGWSLTYGADGAFSILDDYIKNDQLLFDQYIWPPTETMIDMQSLLDDRQLDAYQNIILGNPVSEFDAFVEDWNRMGGSDMTKEVNAIQQRKETDKE